MRKVKVYLLITVGFFLGSCADNHQTITTLSSPAGANSAQPHLSLLPSGQPLLSWLETKDSAATLKYSRLVATIWTPASTVSEGTDWFVNWADFPSVVPLSEDKLAAHWLKKRPGGTYAYDVVVSHSEDSGETWSEALTPHTDATATEHGFVSLFPWQQQAGLIWLDGREMAVESHGNGTIDDIDHSNHSTDSAKGMTLRSAIIHADNTLSQEHVIDDLVCECCQTDAATTSNGPVVIYRNRTAEEIRDIYISRFDEGKWTQGQAIAEDLWEIEGCPVNGPAIAAKGESLVIAWFTLAGGVSKVRFIQSLDAGQSFSTPVDIDTESPIGRVDVDFLADDSAAISWVRRSNTGVGEIVVSRVTPEGIQKNLLVIAPISTSRPSGFPQMVHTNDSLVFAWTDITDGISTVKTARLETTELYHPSR